MGLVLQKRGHQEKNKNKNKSQYWRLENFISIHRLSLIINVYWPSSRRERVDI